MTKSSPPTSRGYCCPTKAKPTPFHQKRADVFQKSLFEVSFFGIAGRVIRNSKLYGSFREFPSRVGLR